MLIIASTIDDLLSHFRYKLHFIQKTQWKIIVIAFETYSVALETLHLKCAFENDCI